MLNKFIIHNINELLYNEFKSRCGQLSKITLTYEYNTFKMNHYLIHKDFNYKSIIKIICEYLYTLYGFKLDDMLDIIDAYIENDTFNNFLI
jgi:hypothetical protein